jgi:tripartite-type tricarboxylate transporter receptor subunit TctC
MFKKFLLIVAALMMSISSSFAVDFSGKTVTWMIPFGAGGGSDKWARYYAPMLSKALPGNPTVVVQNCPGGNGTKCSNQFAQLKNGDGLTILGDSGSTKIPFLLDDKRVQYNPSKWPVVLSSPTGGAAYVSTTTGYKSFADFKKLQGKKVKYGSQGATSLDLIPLIAFDMLGLQVEAIMGYKGRGPARVAFERGEMTLDYQTSSAYLKSSVPLIKEGKATALFSWGVLDDNGNIVRDPTFPDLPSFAEYYEKVHGKRPKGPAWSAWKTFFASGFGGQKMVFLPEGTSPEIVKVYSDAFAKIVASDEFKKTAEKQLGKYSQATGKAAVVAQKEAFTIDAKSKEWIKSHLAKKYAVKF